MNVLITGLVLTIAVAFANGDPSVTYKCDYPVINKTRTITYNVSSTSPVVLSLYGVDGYGVICNVPFTNNKEMKLEVFNETTKKEYCGVTFENDIQATLVFTTSSCDGCITLHDKKYSITCPFDAINSNSTQDVNSRQITVTGIVGTGSAEDILEDITLEVVDTKGDSDPSPQFGDLIRLRATLVLLAGAATGIHITDCTATNPSVKAMSVELIKNSCTPSGLGLIEVDKGFNKDIALSDVKKYVTHSPVFPTFVYTDNTADLLFTCTVKFCFNDNIECDKSCSDETGRKRRAADDDKKEKKVVVLIRVRVDNSSEPISPAGHGGYKSDECSNRTYVIGLAVLGCVLVLTFIVTVGMFVVLRGRRHGDQCDKVGYVNKCVS